jgi:hypothetical protein
MMAIPSPSRPAAIHIVLLPFMAAAPGTPHDYDCPTGDECTTQLYYSPADLVKIPVLPLHCLEEAFALASTLVADGLELTDADSDVGAKWGEIVGIISDPAIAVKLEVSGYCRL